MLMPIPVRTQPSSQPANAAEEHVSKIPQATRSTTTTLSRAPSKSTSQATAKHTDGGRHTKESGPAIAKSARAAGKPVPGHARSYSTISAREIPITGISSQIPPRKLDSTSTITLHSRGLSVSTGLKTDSRTQHGRGSNLAGSASKIGTTPSSAPDLKKPEFNTYNRQYSPKKPNRATAPNFATHSTTQNPRSAATSEPCVDIGRLRDELLQLSLLHDNAATTLKEYESSIRAQMGAGLQDVQRQLNALKALEHDRHGKINAHAVQSWLEEQPDRGQPVPNTLLLLAHCVRELYEMNEERGPLHDLMKDFDAWQNEATSKLSKREIDKDQGEEGFLTPRAPSWSTLVSSVQNKTQACADYLAALRVPSDESSLYLLVSTHSNLAEQMLREIEICRSVEGLILRHEQDWIHASITKALSEVETRSCAQPRNGTDRVGVWDVE